MEISTQAASAGYLALLTNSGGACVWPNRPAATLIACLYKGASGPLGEANRTFHPQGHKATSAAGLSCRKRVFATRQHRRPAAREPIGDQASSSRRPHARSWKLAGPGAHGGKLQRLAAAGGIASWCGAAPAEVASVSR